MTRRVLVTGGTGGIGVALVEAFAERDYEVHFTFKGQRDAAERLSNETGAEPHLLDFLADWSPPEIDVDVLVNSAGINLSGHFYDRVSQAEFNQTVAVNVWAVVRLCQAYLPAMQQRRFGRVVNINSIYGLTAPERRLSYSVSKFGLQAVTRTLAREVAADGVTVNEICPGAVDTSMLREMAITAVQEGRYATVEAYMESVEHGRPSRRLIAPGEVAAGVLFLASEEASGCTGISLRIDGGELA